MVQLVQTREQEVSQWKNKRVRHFKGGEYMVIDIALHTETLEQMVIYRGLYGKYELFTRPLKMFAEKCSDEQFRQYGQEYRLELV